MRENTNNWNRSQEREISIRDLFWEILYGWRFLIVSALILAVLLGGYSYIKSWKSVKNAGVQNHVSIEDLEKSLSVEEREDVNQAKSIQKQIEEKEEYQKESILMNLDAYHQDRKMLQYYVDTNYTWSLNKENEEDYVKELLGGYAAYIDTQGILDDIREEVNWKEEDTYIGELLAVADTDEAKSMYNTFIVYVTGKDKEMVQKLSDAVEKAMKEYQSVLTEKIGAHELVLVDSHESVFVNKGLLTQQEELDTSISTCKTQLDTLVNEFSEVQKQILNGIKDESWQQTQETVSLKAGVSKKYILLGGFAGILLSILWIVLRYILSKKIKNAEEIQQIYGLRILGNLSSQEGEEKKRFLSVVDDWLVKKQGKEKWSREEKRELILTNLLVTCKKESFQKVFFTSSLHLGEEDKKELYFFIEKLEETGVQAVFEENIIRNAKAFEQMAEMGHVVLVEKAGKTVYETLEKQLTLCGEQGAGVIGMIVLE